MDIFNREKVADLEKEVERLRKLEAAYIDVKRLLSEAEYDLREVLQVKESIPEDCTPGPYCKACEFGKEYHFEYHSYWDNHNNVTHGVLCNKANVCGNFIQKEVKSNA